MASPNGDQTYSDEEFEMIDNKFPSTKEVTSSMEKLSVNLKEETTNKKKIDEDVCDVSEIQRLREELERKDEQMRDALTDKDTEIDHLQRENENLKKKMDEMEQKLKNSTEDLSEFEKTLSVLRNKSEETVPYGSRTIRFRKVDGKFGAKHIGNMISEIEKDGPAGLAGLIKGDQIISINGINIETLSKDSITKLSEDVSDDVTLVVRFNPERLRD